MNLQYQVCSLESSKKLKELGVSQRSLFYTISKKDGDIKCFGIVYLNFFHDLDDEDSIDNYEYYSAFTASELMELLPQTIDIKQNEPFNYFRFIMNRSLIVDGINKDIIPTFIANYKCDSCKADHFPIFANLFEHNIYDENLSNCLAKLLIKLYEIGYIKNE